MIYPDSRPVPRYLTAPQNCLVFGQHQEVVPGPNSASDRILRTPRPCLDALPPIPRLHAPRDRHPLLVPAKHPPKIHHRPRLRRLHLRLAPVPQARHPHRDTAARADRPFVFLSTTSVFGAALGPGRPGTSKASPSSARNARAEVPTCGRACRPSCSGRAGSSPRGTTTKSAGGAWGMRNSRRASWRTAGRISPTW